MDSDASTGVLDILSESVLITMSMLVKVLSGYDNVNLPVDLLSKALADIISVVIRPGTPDNARGNLYSAINEHLSLLSVPTTFADDASVASIGREGPGHILRRATIAVIGQKKSRFLAALSRDAMTAREVWKTECFALLGVLVGACASDRDREVLSPLFKEGHLPLFVRGIKDSESAVQESLSPEAGESWVTPTVRDPP
jgi:nuclear pore complex protein Nup205